VRITKTDKIMAKNYKWHYVNSTAGRVNIDINANGVVLKQTLNGTVTGTISLTPDEMEKLGGALFSIKKSSFPNPQQPQVASANTSSFTSNPTATNHMSQMKAQYNMAYASWTTEEEERLKKYDAQGLNDSEISKLLGRNEGAIVSRKKKLGLS
jgi:uncharacterized protein involved in copper resistance